MGQAYGHIRDMMLLAAVALMAVRLLRKKGLRGDACVACGKTNGHEPGCPGRRGY